MKILAAIATAIAVPLAALVALLVVVAGAAGGASGRQPSTAATADIPAQLLRVYRAAAASCPLPWPVLAAIGKVESDHARSPMPGVRSGANSAGAEGPLQFLPSTWAAYGMDGDGDGVADVYNPVDAIWGAARLLCADGAGAPATLRQAIFAYNHADWYVDDVLAIAASYAGAGSAAGMVGGHALPLDRDLLAAHPAWLSLPHHHYPAIDLPVPVGTAVYAAAAGTVVLTTSDAGACGGTAIIDGDDVARYTYCHLSALAVTNGQRVAAGDLVGRSGGAVGLAGAGNSSGPHLHFGISVNGVSLCPQPVLQAWLDGAPFDPTTAPSSGCTT